MSRTVLYMSMSVDGFIAGPNAGPGNGLGDKGQRLHEWFLPDADAEHRTGSHLAGVNREVMDEAMATGAVVVGRRTFELADGWGGDHHDGVPIFVLSRRQPDPKPRWPGVTYVSDVAAAVGMAKDAAGDKDVLVHGARTAQLALAAGVLDELQIHLVPVLLGQGEPLFEDMSPEHIELELLRDVDGPGVTHLRYRVRTAG
ncbi:dihydrofolate reductase family protein [Actinoallomurus iriomotensis]|uniref:Riboflavin biosynthesis protein n=1 Tax=Actinoallomurus iriomotensis TaxID=478107 RepID=A0A9W6W2A1_9ACTN|nr:dihydrofolate reductase family protein [Actinoallomurus iriomotensis]GLY86736.1 riboflavin biosynthesis protein [Actinoallomurus iriomotensis]